LLQSRSAATPPKDFMDIQTIGASRPKLSLLYGRMKQDEAQIVRCQNSNFNPQGALSQRELRLIVSEMLG
jgi:hypothetical protein